MYFASQHTKCMCAPSAALSRLHAGTRIASLSLTKRDLWKCFLLPLSAAHRAYSCQLSMPECMQIYACNMFMSLLQHVFLVPRSRKQLNPHHHYLHHTPPPFPMGLSTQINWKKEECTVVLPLHLSGRESRRGCTHGPYRGTISLHLSQTVLSLMGWNIAYKYIYLYHRCVLASSVSSLYQFPDAVAFFSDYFPPTSQHPHSHLANYAFKSSSAETNCTFFFS